jgi:hypothetical protein
LGYTSSIECNTDCLCGFFNGIIDMKVIVMSVSIEDSCYCVLKPERKYTRFTNCLNVCVLQLTLVYTVGVGRRLLLLQYKLPTLQVKTTFIYLGNMIMPVVHLIRLPVVYPIQNDDQ